MERSCAVTGQSPIRFKFKYNENNSLCKKVKRVMMEQFVNLHDDQGVSVFYVGGTLGIDMWAGEIILRLKEKPGYGDIELMVVLPFKNHDRAWDERSKKRMAFLLKHCREHFIIGERDCRESYINRNCFMVNHADYLLAVTNYMPGFNVKIPQMVAYALEKKKTIIYVNADTAEVQEM